MLALDIFLIQAGANVMLAHWIEPPVSPVAAANRQPADAAARRE